MSLLQELQESVIQENVELGPIPLKLRLLASRLGSSELEDWVRYESEGYPTDVPLPNYRKIGVTYTGTFSGAFGSGIRNAPIPSYLVEKYAGKNWTNYNIRQSIAAVDELIESSAGSGGSLQINASNLILLIQGNVYEDYACNDIKGTISRASLAEIRHAVKSRILELTIELEKTIPGSAEVTFGNRQHASSEVSEKVTQIYHQVFYGNVTSINSSGSVGTISVSFNTGDSRALEEYLSAQGISSDDAHALAEIVASEEPGGSEEPLGEKARKWVAENIRKAADGSWKVGISVATEVIKKAALRYYGLD